MFGPQAVLGFLAFWLIMMTGACNAAIQESIRFRRMKG